MSFAQLGQGLTGSATTASGDEWARGFGAGAQGDMAAFRHYVEKEKQTNGIGGSVVTGVGVGLTGGKLKLPGLPDFGVPKWALIGGAVLLVVLVLK